MLEVTGSIPVSSTYLSPQEFAGFFVKKARLLTVKFKERHARETDVLYYKK